jgi:hypothetical protein
MDTQVEAPEYDIKQAIRVEQEVTRQFRELVRLIGFGEAWRLFDAAGLNNPFDRPLSEGKEDIAAEVVDSVAYALMVAA